MAGILTNLIPKRVFDFSDLAMSSSRYLVIAEQIDILQFCDGILITRVHAASLGGGGIQLQLQPDGHVPGDSTLFYENAGYFAQGILLDSTTPAGGLYNAGNDSTEGFHGRYAKLTMSAARSVAVGDITATLSVDLLLRSPDDTDGFVAREAQACGGCRCDC